jgi:splicing factor U2AF 65 kDa subunit
MTEEILGQHIFATMKERGMVPATSLNPVLHVWFAREKGGTYGFVEFATLEDTDNALTLDGFYCMGQPIIVKRPSDYTTPLMPPSFPGIENLLPGAAAGVGSVVNSEALLAKLQAAAAATAGGGGNLMITSTSASAGGGGSGVNSVTSRILRFNQVMMIFIFIIFSLGFVC